ncbi:VWA domain-containing protein [Chloroflexota bacterium]
MNFHFASPWLLSLLILVPFLVAPYIWAGRRTKPATMKHASASMVRDVSNSWRITLRPILSMLRLLAIALIIIALARPQIVQAKETISGEGVEIALALDISGSMASLDFEPQNRLEAAKSVIGDFIASRQYDKIGLVIFSSEAFSLSPLTLDHNLLNRSLNDVQLASELGLEDGTAIGLGIANAANMLMESESESKVIILLTDGMNNAGEIDPLTAAEAAKALGVKVYTIGAARPGEVPVPVDSMLGGTQIVYQESMLDEETLQQVAEITGGRYFRAENSQGLQSIYNEINDLEKSQVEVQIFNQYFELAALLLVPALIIILLELALQNTILRKLP